MRIAVTGPENSGKSALSVALSEVLECSYTPEFARFDLQENTPDYTLEDFNRIVDGQIEWMREATQSTGANCVFDTDLFVLEIWEEVRFSSCSLLVHQTKQELEVDLILVCSPDLPWEEDPLRESKEELELLFEMYLQRAKSSGVAFGVIEGPQRLEQAWKFVQQKRGSLA